MSAPTRVSQNGKTACFTDTAELPFGLPLPDHVISLPSAVRRAVDPFAASPLLSVDASMLSWLQSRLLMSMPVMSTSVSASEPGLAGCAAEPSREPACELSCGGLSCADGAWAHAGVASPASRPKTKPATSQNAPAVPFNSLEVMTRARVPAFRFESIMR
jgi:hypothetical protein